MFYVCKDSANTIHMYFLYVTFSLHSLFYFIDRCQAYIFYMSKTIGHNSPTRNKSC